MGLLHLRALLAAHPADRGGSPLIESPWITGLAALGAVYWLVTAVRLGRGMPTIGFLRDRPPVDRAEAPSVTVCVAARDEADGVEAGVGSMVALDYPRLEVVAVDDRSTDGTGDILDRLAARHEPLRVLHVEELPPGWLGKNHALARAADEARGDLLLFTDADVVMEPDALSRAVGHLERQGLGHLAVGPDLAMPGPLLQAFAGAFAIFFSRIVEPWRAREPGSGRHVGVGAFNLVRTRLYRAAGGHGAIRMRPDDDMRLGELVKRAGGRQDLLYGTGMIRVRWYERLGDAVRGLSRAAWSVLDYSYPAAAASLLATLLLDVWPWAGVIVTGGAARPLNLVCVLLSGGIMAAASAYSDRARAWHALLWPVAGLVLAWITFRSVAGTLLRGGIVWRGTFYPLEELRGGA